MVVKETLALALPLALASAVALNWSYYRQHEQASELPPLQLKRPLRSLRLLVADLRWLVGVGAMFVGWVLYVAALVFGPLSLVQSVSAGGIGVLALLVWRLGGVRLSGREWAGVTVSMLGLLLLGLSLVGGADAHSQIRRSDLLALLVWLAVSAAVAAAAAGPAGRRLVSGAGLGVAAGLLFAAGDVATKAAVAGGWWLLFALPMLASQGAGFALLQFGFQRGQALATAGLATLFTNAVPIAAGMVLFHEPLPGDGQGILRVLSFSAVIVGATLLARPEEPAPTAETAAASDSPSREADPGRIT